MTKSKKIILLIVTLWPVIYLAIFFTLILSTFLLPGPSVESNPVFNFSIIFPIHILTMLIMTILFVIYIMHILKSGRVKKDDRVLWAILLLMGNSIAMLVYWYLFIWKTTPQKTNKSSRK